MDDTAAMTTEVNIDDSLYSRQRYVLGDSAMKRMAQSSVLLVGCGALGIEIAKNVVLAGVKSVTLLDDTHCTTPDLGCQFFIRESDISQNLNRAIASAPRLAELNPYVTVAVVTGNLEGMVHDHSLLQYQCVILTETPITTMVHVDAFCRSQSPSIKFISGDVHGLLATGFCDFGQGFQILDPSGEEPKMSFVGDITKSNPGVVTTFDKGLHGLESGDYVTFREINGMTVLNGQQVKIQVINPYTYSICDTSGEEYDPYQHGGIATQVIQPRTMTFNSLKAEIINPSLSTPDLSKFEAPPQLHLAYLTIKKLLSESSSDNVSSEHFLETATLINSTQHNKVAALDESLLQTISQTYRGCLAPLCAVMGGLLAQECLKSLTSKFTPLSQWLHAEATDIVKDVHIEHTSSFIKSPDSKKKLKSSRVERDDRYRNLRLCIGDSLTNKLASVNLFMVGCGAIGCEMLKNLALLGVGTQGAGKVTITDHDLIEKSNLNRQFLFRPHHIRLPKSTTAAGSACDINKDMKIDAHQHKVCPATQSTIYTDSFFQSQHVCVNALDNVEARRYMDSRCVTNQRALLETGTMGSKGHVQVIVPHLTESYTSQQEEASRIHTIVTQMLISPLHGWSQPESDPADQDIPYCTLKSFPATLEHCIQWARDKFESSFAQKPTLYNKFWSTQQDVDVVIQTLRNDENIEGAIQITRILPNKPPDWPHCLRLARLKFEKYFNHRAKQLIHAFPLDSLLSDNTTLFWQSPKRPPSAQNFDINNPLHDQFIVATARLYADMENIAYLSKDMTTEHISDVLEKLTVPEFVPSGKKIEISPDAKKPELEESMEDELSQAGTAIQSYVTTHGVTRVLTQMSPIEFEKDDDDNAHIDFISAAANLRASMYSIDTGDRLEIKRIAGRIIPAIATTTATVAGLATLELLKIIKGSKIDEFRNCFLNLAMPVVLLTEPGAAVQETIRAGLTFTPWDIWHVYGNAAFTLQMFMDHFQASLFCAKSVQSHPFESSLNYGKYAQPVPTQSYS